MSELQPADSKSRVSTRGPKAHASSSTLVFDSSSPRRTTRFRSLAPDRYDVCQDATIASEMISPRTSPSTLGQDRKGEWSLSIQIVRSAFSAICSCALGLRIRSSVQAMYVVGKTCQAGGEDGGAANTDVGIVRSCAVAQSASSFEHLW